LVVKKKESLGEVGFRFKFDDPVRLTINYDNFNLEKALKDKEKQLLVKSKFNDQKFRSPINEKSSAWLCEFVNCHDYDKINFVLKSGKIKVLGTATVDIGELKKHIETGYLLEFKNNGELVASLNIKLKIEGICYEQEHDTLVISSSLAINVPPSDTSGLSNSYIKITYKDKITYTSDFIRDSIHPVWSPPFKIELMNAQDDDVLKIGFWDWNQGKGVKRKSNLLAETTITVR